MSRCAIAMLALFVSFSVPGPVGRVARAETLYEALERAYRDNPRLTAGRAQLRAVDEDVSQALSGFRPTITIDGSAVTNSTETKLKHRDSVTTDGPTADTGLTLRQSLYSGGGTVASVAAAEESVKAQRFALLSTEQDVFYDVVDAYTSTWRDRSVLDLALSNEDRIRRQLQATRDRYRVGDVARTDVAQAEARLARARSDIEQAKANLAGSVAAYRDVTGIAPDQLEDPKPLENLPESIEAAHELAMQNPLVQSRQHLVENSLHTIDVARSNLLPTVDLLGDVSYTDRPAAGTDWRKNAQIGVVVSVPLYQGGRVYSEVRQTKQVLKQRRSELENSQRSIQRQVSTAWEVLQAARVAIVAIESQVKANRVALAGVQEEATVGQRTVLDVLDAEQELFQSQTDLVQARAAEVLAAYQLKSAVGQLTVASLDLDVPAYDPKIYYDRQRSKLFGVDGADLKAAFKHQVE
ncbi:MAG: TolC family outer membrane protein [Geminicoccaceae bacterium]|nr:TolC family outer membrane protein [Geminicoccaceae bacterium]MCB9942938.1 TolC family outer membrane protein [Geminicoccaceae bacterium]